MAETLADLYRRVGLHAAWEDQPEARPGFRRQTPAQARANPETRDIELPESRAQRSFREQAYQDVMRHEAGRNEFNSPPNRYIGQDILEATGAPALSRSFDRIAEGDPAGALPEAIMGGLGILGTTGAPSVRGARVPLRAPPMAELPPPRLPVNPARLPARATDGSVLPLREPEPFRTSLSGGSDDLADATRMRPDAGGVQGGRDPGAEILAGLSDRDPMARHLGMRARDVVAALDRVGRGGRVARADQNVVQRLVEHSRGRDLDSAIQRYYRSNEWRRYEAPTEIVDNAEPPSMRGRRTNGFVVRARDGDARGYDIEAPGGGVLTTKFEPARDGRIEIDFDRIGGPDTLSGADARRLLRQVVDAVRTDAAAHPDAEYFFVSASPTHQRVYEAMLREFGLPSDTPTFRASQALPDGSSAQAGREPFVEAFTETLDDADRQHIRTIGMDPEQVLADESGEAADIAARLMLQHENSPEMGGTLAHLERISLARQARTGGGEPRNVTPRALPNTGDALPPPRTPRGRR